MISKRFHKWGARKVKTRSNVFILPSVNGFYFVFTNFVIFLVGLTYANNIALLISFILVSYFIMTMIESHFIMKNLEVQSILINNAFCGEGNECRIAIKNNNQVEVNSFKAVSLKSDLTLLDNKDSLAPGETALKLTLIYNLQRGLYTDNRIRISSTGTYGLFNTWSYIAIPIIFYVYPKRSLSKSFSPINGDTSHVKNENDYVFDSYKTFEVGMNNNRIDWKKYALTDQLFIRSYINEDDNTYSFDFDNIEGDLNLKIQRLTFLIYWAFKKKCSYELILPHTKINQNKTEKHFHDCLKELAIL